MNDDCGGRCITHPLQERIEICPCLPIESKWAQEKKHTVTCHRYSEVLPEAALMVVLSVPFAWFICYFKRRLEVEPLTDIPHVPQRFDARLKSERMCFVPERRASPSRFRINSPYTDGIGETAIAPKEYLLRLEDARVAGFRRLVHVRVMMSGPTIDSTVVVFLSE